MKVDVQIKISKNDKDYIFTGVGTAQRDDDDDVDFGGLVYVYNSQNVILYPPAIGKGTVRTPGLAYTGSSFSRRYFVFDPFLIGYINCFVL